MAELLAAAWIGFMFGCWFGAVYFGITRQESELLKDAKRKRYVDKQFELAKLAYQNGDLTPEGEKVAEKVKENLNGKS